MIEGIPVDRARVRLTGTYQFHPRLSAGIEYNPQADDVGLLANWRVLDETATRPALIVGRSSDRIGTPSGRAIYATISKSLEPWTGLPVAPYVGTAFGSFEDEFRLIGGAQVRWAPKWTSTHLWDGVNLHHILDWWPTSTYRVGLVAAGQEHSEEYYFGLSAGASL